MPVKGTDLVGKTVSGSLFWPGQPKSLTWKNEPARPLKGSVTPLMGGVTPVAVPPR
jgi:hypothetical protein